jgi:mannose-6-phosphate isomerase
MIPDAPLSFVPILKERIWGGDSLVRLFGRSASTDVPIGESWEVVDRPEEVSVVATGPWKGTSLRELLERFPKEMLGGLPTQDGRFPWLIKILDARADLSLQVHPPAAKAERLGGQPKTEMWYIAEASPEATIHVGLQPGVTRAVFEARTRDGSVAACFHRHQVRAGDAMFLPSGRVHALGAGNVVFEVQQNSDTTYRVFDWNRVEKDGRPRALHLDQAFESIDFEDTLPALIPEIWSRVASGVRNRPLIRNSLFDIDLIELEPGRSHIVGNGDGPVVLAGVEGSLDAAAGSGTAHVFPGNFVLFPAAAGSLSLTGGSLKTKVLAVRRHRES